MSSVGRARPALRTASSSAEAVSEAACVSFSWLSVMAPDLKRFVSRSRSLAALRWRTRAVSTFALAVSGRGACARERGLRGRMLGDRVLERGCGLRDLQVELLGVDLDQDLAGVDMLVVLDHDPLDVPGYPREDGADVPLDLGVVGLLVGLVILPVPHAHDGSHDDGNRGHRDDRDLVKAVLGLGCVRSRGGIRDF